MKIILENELYQDVAGIVKMCIGVSVFGMDLLNDILKNDDESIK